MKNTLWLIVLVLLAPFAEAQTVTVSRKYRIGPLVQDDRGGPFVVHRYYKHAYNDVVFVADRVTLADGTEWFLLQNIRGTTCRPAYAYDPNVPPPEINYVDLTCLRPAEAPRGAFREVRVTVMPVEDWPQ